MRRSIWEKLDFGDADSGDDDSGDDDFGDVAFGETPLLERVLDEWHKLLALNEHLNKHLNNCSD